MKKILSIALCVLMLVTALTACGAKKPADDNKGDNNTPAAAVKFGAADHIRQRNLTRFMVNGVPQTERYLAHLEGQIRYVLSVEPDNRAMVKLLADLSASPTYMG